MRRERHRHDLTRESVQREASRRDSDLGRRRRRRGEEEEVLVSKEASSLGTKRKETVRDSGSMGGSDRIGSIRLGMIYFEFGLNSN